MSIARRLFTALGIVLCVAAEAATQAYPARPLRFIAPFAAGGGSDVIARKLAQKLSEALGQAVVVENRTGGSGVIGADATAKSAPDGYTIMMTTPTFTVNPGLMRKLPYDALRDFAPVSLIATAPHLLAVHPSIPAKTVADVVALAQARPEHLTFSSGSTGGSSHLAGELFNSIARIRMTHIPYRGGGQAVLAMMSGEVSLGFVDLVSTLPYVKSGHLRSVALTGAKRTALLPDVPTFIESGYPGFQSGIWYGVVAAGRTPPDIIARLNTELVKIVRAPEFVQSMSAEGADVVASTPEVFGDFLRAEIARWARVIREARIELQ